MAPSTRFPRFNVRTCDPELIVPAKPTPFQVLQLSDLDHEGSLRSLVPNLHFYHYNPSMEKRDPVKIIKDALARTLVFYYPLAGRLRESLEDRRKMVVACTGEGALFIEADADIAVKDLGTPFHPPFPYLNEFMNEVPDMGFDDEILNTPLIHLQVTRMKCGGFVLGTRMSNNMMDGTGVIQFFNALSEMARGAVAPSVPPVWQRELICTRNPPKVTCVHHEFDDHCDSAIIPNMVYRLLFFTSKEISELRKLAPDHLQKVCSSFDLMTTFLWRTRALALQLDPEEKVRLSFAVNARHKFNPPLPKGYYGNAIAFVGVMSTARDLYQNSFGYALEKVRKAKKIVTDEYMRSFIDELVIREYPTIASAMPSFFISDLRRLGFHEVDFGWGKPAYGGPAHAWYEPYPHLDCSFIMCKNGEGQDVTLVAMSLPAPNMDLFMKELGRVIDIRVADPRDNSTVN